MPQSGQERWKDAEAELFRLLVENVKDYAVFVIDSQGRVQTWNGGAERLLGYREEEIIGRSAEIFFTPEDIADGVPQQEMEASLTQGAGNDERWHVRKDGSRFWSGGMMTPLWDEDRRLRGFAKVMRDRTEWKQREEQERLQHVLLDSVAQAVIATTPDGTVIYWNRCAEMMFGWTKGEAIGRNVIELTVPEEQAVNADPIMRRVAAGESWSGEFFVRRRDGTIFPALVTNNPILDENGQVSAIVGVSWDCSERKHAETLLRHSEERFRSLMEQAPFSIQVFSPDGRTIRVNRAWEELWGVRFDQTKGYNVLKDKQLAAKGVLEYIERGFAGQTTRIPAIEYNPNESIPNLSQHPNPRRWLSAVIYPITDADGNVREVVLIHEDITARHQAEDDRRKFAFLVENSRDFIGMCDMSMKPFFVNREGLRLVGLESVEQFREMQVTDFFFPEDRQFMTEEFFPQVLQQGHGQAEVRFRHFKTGQPIWFNYSVVVMRNAAGQPEGFATISRDISRLKRANEALRDTDRRKDEFLATLAHELRNPLAPIRNALQILKLPGIDAVTTQQTRDMMERQVHQLVRLVDDLLDVSRVMRGKVELRREPVELAAVVARAIETAQPFIDAQGHLLDVSIPSESLLLDADSVRLAQAISNLLTNAAKYTEPNGHIWLTADRQGNETSLRVRDDGIGIAPDMLPRIFELFVQVGPAASRSQGGLGIGLTLVKNLIEIHGGSVTAQSQGAGAGSEFIVRLPLLEVDRRSDDESRRTNVQPDTVCARCHRLLVVDDNRDAAVSLSILLSLQGHDVRVAHDGPSALEVAAEFRPVLIFLDIGMPGMDGYEVARRVRQTPELGNVVLTALTGWGQAEDRRRTAEVGFDHHLVKPPEPQAVEAILERLGSHKRPG